MNIRELEHNLNSLYLGYYQLTKSDRIEVLSMFINPQISA